MLNIVFVKFGNLYSYKHVNLLFKDLSKYYPDAKYWCYTDNNKDINSNIHIISPLERPTLRKWWNKLPLFSDAMPFEGECLFFDLDMEIKADPSHYITFNGLTVINSYWKDDLYFDNHAYDVNINSSIITWNAGEQTHIWNNFVKNKDYYMRKYAGIDRFLIHEGFNVNTFEDGIVDSILNSKYNNAPVNMYNGTSYTL